MNKPKKNYKQALYFAAEKAYQDEVIETDMEQHIIGEGKDYANKAEWIDACIAEWLEGGQNEQTIKTAH